LSEPVAVVVGFVVLGSSAGGSVFVAGMMACVAGMMTAVCLFELLPMAAKAQGWHLWMCGGMTLACLPSLLIG
jgi:zinc transporter ZupT